MTLEDLRVQDGRNNFPVAPPAGVPTSSGGAIGVTGISSGIAPSLTLDNVTVASSSVESTGTDGVARGGGVFAGNNVTLSLIDSVVTDNTASGGTGGGKGTGAGIYALGPTTIVNSTVSDNAILSGAGTREGGGIAADNFATLSLLRSTVSGNDAGANGGGGGIRWGGGGSGAITDSTISDNDAGTAGGGGIQTQVSMTVSASTLAANTAPGGSGADLLARFTGTTAKSSIFASLGACALADSGTITSAGRNLDNGTSCGFGTANGNLQNANPMLGPLEDNGGPTFTRELMVGSPAIDAGAAVTGTDQRGIARPQGAGCDIGAFELEQANDAAACTVTSVPPAVVQPPVVNPDPPKKKTCRKGFKLKKGKCVKKRKKKK